MTRPRSSVPERARPARHRSVPWLLLPVLAALLAVGCIGQEEVRDEPSPTPTASAPVVSPSAEPTREPGPTAETTPAPTAAPSETPTPAPTVATSEAPPSGQAGSADACTGTDDNREFFADVATAFDWDVYCGILPDRWSVASGQYRSAGGGWMVISYEGPGGATFELHEGAFCGEAEGCAPDGDDTGPAAFGDRPGTLVAGDDGRYAVVVDRGDQISWMALGSGLDLEAFKRFAAGVMRIEG